MQKRKTILLVSFLVVIFSLVNVVFGEWEVVGPGFEYRKFTIAGPVEVFVVRMSRASTNCIIDTMIASGRLNKTGLPYSGREPVSAMANRYNDTINYWGEGTVNYWGNRSQIIAAINGDFFSYDSGLPTSGQIQDGWFCKRFLEYAGGSGFVWKLNRTCFLGGNVRNGDAPSVFSQIVVISTSTATITRLNTARGANEIVLYTPQYGPHTYTDDSGVEVLVKMNRPTLPFPEKTSYASGTIVQIRRNLGSTYIPFDHVVLSAHGNKTTFFSLSHCTVGQEVKIFMHIKDYGRSGTYPLPYDQDWGKAYSAIGGGVYCVVSSQVPSADWNDDPTRHPRTAIAFNSTYIYFVVADGRRADSIGMSYTELGNFCRDSLNAEFAINLDGGGSSTLWVNGQIKNRPSDGSERYVANGVAMINVLPMSKTSTFREGDSVRVPLGGSLRLGPGTNYSVFTTISAGSSGNIVPHPLNGVLAKGENWWKCKFGDVEGWIEEKQLTILSVSNWDKYQ